MEVDEPLLEITNPPVPNLSNIHRYLNDAPPSPVLFPRSPEPEQPIEEQNPMDSDTEKPSQDALTQKSAPDECTQDSKPDLEDEDDGTLCPICLDNWTNTGDHRMCSLKCGHLFGYKCVTRWLELQSKKSCPTCKKKVNRSDLRFIYAKKLVAVDTSELETMREQLNEALTEKNRVLQDITRYVSREHILNQEIMQLKKRIRELTGENPSYHPGLPSHSMVRLYMDKSIDVCKQNGCRVFDASKNLDSIVVSMKSPANLWSGYGIRKIHVPTYKQLIFLPLHDLQIRDVCFHPTKNWILTVSMDKKFKVVDIQQNNVLYSMDQSMPLWSCAWDSNNENMLYIGTQHGECIKYDIRNVNSPVANFSVPGDMSPVVSVASVPSGPHSDLINGGVIICKLNSLWVFENQGESHMRHALPLEGPYVSMKYQAETKQLLVSSRPNNRISYSRHTLLTMEKLSDPDSINCHIIHSFQGSGMQKLLSKSCFITDKQDYVAAYHEANKSVYLWSINTGEKVCSVPAHEAVLDLRGVQSQTGSYLVSLTDRRMEFFKFNTS